MSKQGLIQYLCIMSNDKITLKGVARIATPVIISEFLEEALILTDSILLSYKPDVYLASVGIIDAILLIILAYGVALNDSYQNFFARYENQDLVTVLAIFKNAWKKFLCSGVAIAILILSLTQLGILFANSNNIIACVNQSIWFILPLALLSYTSMWLNSFLMGLVHVKLLSIVSICCVFVNGLCGYFLLFKVKSTLTPTSIILLTSALSELLAVAIMWIYIRKRYHHRENGTKIRHQKLLSRTFSLASIYPALSEIGFHIGSLVLFIFCTYFFPQNQVALLSLIFSYWGLMQVPVDGLQEISLNYFAKLYSNREMKSFLSYSRQLIRFARGCCIILFVIVITSDLLFEDWSNIKFQGIILVFLISLFACGTEIFNTSLIVRLKNDSYMIGKLIFAILATGLVLIGRFLLHVETILSILCPFLLAQIAENVYCSIRAKTVWLKSRGI